MDLRIVNTCNNNCLYCLEQAYRKKYKFIDDSIIYEFILKNKKYKDNNINFYGGNPLLHPNLLEIIKFCKNNGFESIGLLTNTFGLNKNNLQILIKNGLNNIGFYFNSFNLKEHNTIVNGGINLLSLLNNIEIISKSGIFYKSLIHINNQNISNLYKYVYILYKKYNVLNFDFINYFPFDRPYEKFNSLLMYDYNNNRNYINNLFKVIKSNDLKTYFVKFSKDFFGDFSNFYSFDNGVINQIGEEDILRLNSNELPFCFLEKRCNNCFIKDNCKFVIGT